MQQNPLTVIVRVKPEKRDELEELLTTIGQNLHTNNYIRFGETGTTHFARFVLIGSGKRGVQNEKTRLLFTSNHDGTWQNYVDQLLTRAGRGMEAIFSKCEGYPDLDLKWATRDERMKFKRYIWAHSYPSQAFFQGYPGYSVQEIKGFQSAHEQLVEFLCRKEFEPLLSALSQVPSAKPSLSARLEQLATKYPIKRILLKKVLIAIEKRMGPPILYEPTTEISPEVDTRSEMTDSLSSVQNEMTVVAAIKPERLEPLRRFLKVVSLLCKHNPTPGALSGLTTIHFARWAIIDGGRNMLFESNYDGNWEQYIGDFVDKISYGLDAIFGNCIDYPIRGARDMQRFKQIIIDYQVQAQVFYSAYPRHTVRNIRNDIDIGEALSKMALNKEFARVLRRL